MAMPIENPKNANQHGHSVANDRCEWRPGQPSECGDTLWQPPRLDLKFFGYVLTLSCLLFGLSYIQNWPAMVVWAVVGLTWLFGCPRTKRATLSVAPLMFLPYLWFAFYNVRVDDRLTDLLPRLGHAWGLVPTQWALRLLGMGVDSLNGLAAATTIGVFLFAVSIVRFWPKWRWSVFAMVLITAVTFSGLIYQMR